MNLPCNIGTTVDFQYSTGWDHAFDRYWFKLDQAIFVPDEQLEVAERFLTSYLYGASPVYIRSGRYLHAWHLREYSVQRDMLSYGQTIRLHWDSHELVSLNLNCELI